MEKFDLLLEKYGINVSNEFFYIILNLISDDISIFEDLISHYKGRDDFENLKLDYKKFFDYVEDTLDSIDLSNDVIAHQKIYSIVSYLLNNDRKSLENRIQIYISNILDVVFVKYKIDISKFKTNEEIREYLYSIFKKPEIVNSLFLLLLADTSLSEEYIKHISYEEFEHLLVNLIFLVVYLHKESK